MYEKYWGLKEKPFQNTPDPHFLYFSSQHKQAFSKLAYTAEERKGASLLTGVFGCGKTVVAQALVEKLQSSGEYKTAVINHPQLSSVEFLRAIVSALGGVKLPSTKGELLTDYLLESLKNILTQNMKDGKHTVLVIDEAHVIKDPDVFEELRLLLNFQLKKHFLLTMFIVGQPDLAKNIRMNKQLLQRISFFSHLTNFGKADTYNYIAHRLKVAGAKKEILTDDAIDAVYSKSGGIPRRINQICDTALFLGSENKVKAITEKEISDSLAYAGEIGIEEGIREEEVVPKEETAKEPLWKMGWQPTEENQEEKQESKQEEKSRQEENKEKIKAKTTGKAKQEAFLAINLEEYSSVSVYNNCIMLVENIFNRLVRNETIESSMLLSLARSLVEKIKKDFHTLWAQTSKTYPLNSSYLYYHSVNVAVLAILLGLDLEYDDEKLVKLAISALLHDIGMCKIPKQIIEKPGKLTKEEYAQLQKHPIIGSEILLGQDSKELNGITTRVILEHHEREDGTGYPNGKIADQILEFSKIVSLVNIYESLIHDRCYRTSAGTYKAMVQIIDLDEKGFFNKDLSRIFIQKFSFYPIGSWVRVNTEEIGRVIAINEKSLASPVVKVLFDSQLQPLPEPKIINLAKRPKFSIKEVVADPRDNKTSKRQDPEPAQTPKSVYQELLSKTEDMFKRL